jgi:hypothetical protein
MKQLLILSMLILLCLGANAQAGKVIVKNTSPCSVIFNLRGAPAPNCGIGTGSADITITPGATLTYPNSASIPGFPTSPIFFISGATARSQPTSCGTPTYWTIGEPCVVPPVSPSLPITNRNAGTCSFCMSGYAIWAPATTLGGTATLIFTIN